MKKEIKKLTKQQKEQIENRLLTVFAVALGSIMVLLYLMNWFRGSKGFQIAAEVAVYLFTVGFIVLAVICEKRKCSGQSKEIQQLVYIFNCRSCRFIPYLPKQNFGACKIRVY